MIFVRHLMTFHQEVMRMSCDDGRWSLYQLSADFQIFGHISSLERRLWLRLAFT